MSCGLIVLSLDITVRYRSDAIGVLGGCGERKLLAMINYAEARRAGIEADVVWKIKYSRQTFRPFDVDW
jgi:hypothetical protein